jgi:hypothetical protein
VSGLSNEHDQEGWVGLLSSISQSRWMEDVPSEFVFVIDEFLVSSFVERIEWSHTDVGCQALPFPDPLIFVSSPQAVTFDSAVHSLV